MFDTAQTYESSSTPQSERRAGEIVKALQEQAKEIVRLHETITTLEHRLKTLCSPQQDTPTPPAGLEKAPQPDLLYLKMRDVSMGMALATKRCQRIMDLLEI